MPTLALCRLKPNRASNSRIPPFALENKIATLKSMVIVVVVVVVLVLVIAAVKLIVIHYSKMTTNIEVIEKQ